MNANGKIIPRLSLSFWRIGLDATAVAIGFGRFPFFHHQGTKAQSHQEDKAKNSFLVRLGALVHLCLGVQKPKQNFITNNNLD
jgi:hypothetical protein